MAKKRILLTQKEYNNLCREASLKAFYVQQCQQMNAEIAELKAAGVGQNPVDKNAFEEAVHQQAKAGMEPIQADPRNDAFKTEYEKQHNHTLPEAEVK